MSPRALPSPVSPTEVLSRPCLARASRRCRSSERCRSPRPGAAASRSRRHNSFPSAQRSMPRTAKFRSLPWIPPAGTHSGVFFEGVFSIQQPPAEQGVVEITLAAPLRTCGGAAIARATSGRHLGSKADPYFSSSGYSARTTAARHHARDAAATSTTWETADGCVGRQRTTVVQAMQGTVAVSSPVTHRPAASNPTVTAGAKPLCYFGRVRVHGRFSTGAGSPPRPCEAPQMRTRATGPSWCARTASRRRRSAVRGPCPGGVISGPPATLWSSG